MEQAVPRNGHHYFEKIITLTTTKTDFLRMDKNIFFGVILLATKSRFVGTSNVPVPRNQFLGTVHTNQFPKNEK